MIFLFLVIFIDAMAYGILAPLLPLLTAAHGAVPFMSGLIMAAFPVCQIAAAPLVGRLSDRLGRKAVLTACLFASAAGYGLAGLGNALAADLAGAALVGAGGASLATAQAALADRAGRTDRVGLVGRTGAAAGLGMMCGAAVAGIFYGLGPMLPILIAGGLALANALVGLLFVDEAAPARPAEAGPAEGGRPRDGGRPIGLVILFAVDCSLSAVVVAYPLHASLSLGWQPAAISLGFAAAGLCSVGAQALLGARLAPRLGAHGTAALGLGAMLAGLGSAFVGAPLPALILFAAGSGLALAAITAWISVEAARAEQGAAFGAAQAVLGLAIAAGSALGGALYGLAGAGAVLLFCSCAVALALAALAPRLLGRGPG